MKQVASHATVAETDPLERRRRPRERISAAVVFGCFTASGAQRLFTGSIEDFAEGGMRIQSDVGFKKGTILLIRILHCSFHLLKPEIGESLRTMMLAEVKWRETFQDALGTRHFMGVRCL